VNRKAAKRIAHSVKKRAQGKGEEQSAGKKENKAKKIKQEKFADEDDWKTRSPQSHSDSTICDPQRFL